MFEVDESKLGAACFTVLIRIAVAAVDLLACWLSLSVDLIGIYRMGRNGFAIPPSHPLQPRGLLNPFSVVLSSVLFLQCRRVLPLHSFGEILQINRFKLRRNGHES